MDNNNIYRTIIQDLLVTKKDLDNLHDNDICMEIIGARYLFHPEGIIDGTSEKYMEAELKWYRAMDLCIDNYDIIKDNPIWKNCATKNGLVNSNYGWAVWSKENHFQYNNALDELLKNKDTRQAIMVYTRPNIHDEKNDGVHANRDMFCTCYTDCLIRDDILIYTVHMRSNDLWYGMRYDLAWHQYLYNSLYEALKQKYKDLKKGHIFWFADSLHVYKRNYDSIIDWLDKHSN